MRNLAFATALSLSISQLAAAPAFAQTAPAAPQAKNTPDPNEVVCQKQEETGSRLASHRVCKTRSEWAEERRLNRMDIDKLQTQRPCGGEGSGSC
jgi:invasion protein IalB